MQQQITKPTKDFHLTYKKVIKPYLILLVDADEEKKKADDVKRQVKVSQIFKYRCQPRRLNFKSLICSLIHMNNLKVSFREGFNQARVWRHAVCARGLKRKVRPALLL